MNSTAILLPSFAMFFLTIGCLLALALARQRGVQRGEVSMRYYRAHQGAAEPERLHVWGRHVQNHFEVPPLFHIAIVLTYVLGAGSAFAVLIAWLFVLSRVLHTIIHLGPNRVTHRFVAFASGVFLLLVLWVNLLFELV